MDLDDDKKVFIGYFHHSVDLNFLKQLFSQFGETKKVWKSNGYPSKLIII